MRADSAGATAPEPEDYGVVDEPVHHGGAAILVAEDFALASRA
jgi:hypothetical protein